MCNGKWVDLKTLKYIISQPKAIQKDLLDECALSTNEIRQNKKIVYKSGYLTLCE